MLAALTLLQQKMLLPVAHSQQSLVQAASTGLAVHPTLGIAAGATCTLTVWVTSTTPGTVTNTINTTDVTDFEGRTLTGPPITANLNVSNLQISKAFYPPTINQNGLSTLTITLTNTNTSTLTGLSVSDTLPVGVIVAPVSVPPGEPYANTDCGGTLTATPSSGSITLTGGNVPAQVGAHHGQMHH